jgi:hypothetical protein
MPSTFTAPEIRRLLDLLENELAVRGTAATMYVVGGAALSPRMHTTHRTERGRRLWSRAQRPSWR